jgi:hypothetical protein
MSDQMIFSSTLFNNPSFMKGAALIVDLFGQLDTYQYSKSGKDADCDSLGNDWIIVGKDISNSVETYGKTTATR